MNEKEKAVLLTLIQEPTLFEKVTIKPSLFKGRSKDILNELERQFQESQSFSEEEASDKLKLKVSQFHELFEGSYKLSFQQFESTLKTIESESLSKEILLLVEKEMRSELKTGLLDKKKNAEIERMFKKRADLNDGSCLSSDFNSITKKGIDWLWSGRIPLGILTLIAGHPGTGKSFFSTWLAAKLSRGDVLPGSKQKMKPCSTLLIAAEDDPASVIKPRLEANGADMSKIIFFKEPLKFSLDSIGILERELDKNSDIRNINIDPLTVFLGTKTDYFRDPDVRLKLVPLQDLAKKRQISIQAVVHLNKKEDADLITRIGGSMAFAGVARSVLGVSYDNRESDEDTRDSRLLSSLKLNLARRPDTLAFKINDNLRIDFNEKPVPIDADTLFSRESRERKQKQSMTDIWLLNYLSEHPDLMSREIVKAAGEEEIPPASIHRSKRKLENQGLLISIESGFGKEHKSYWKLK